MLTLSRKYIPHSMHLALHNGAINEAEDPASDRRPGKAGRDKKSIAARLGAQKRATEIAEQRELDEMMDEETPRKKVGWALLGHFGPFWLTLGSVCSESRSRTPRGRRSAVVRRLMLILPFLSSSVMG